MNLRQRSFAFAALVTLVAVAAPALAQDELDLPTVAVVGQKPSSVKLFVTAGSSGAPNGFAIDWMRKDLRFTLAEARESGARLPLTALVDQFYADVQAMGGGRWDTSSLIRRLTKDDG